MDATTKLHFFGNKRKNYYNKLESANIKSIHCGAGHIEVTDEENKHWVAGRNKYGQCGMANFENYIHECTENTFFHEQHLTISTVCTSINTDNTFWITERGTVYASGYNERGQLGLCHNNNDNQSKPQHIEELHHVVHVAAGRWHNLALCQRRVSLRHIEYIVNQWSHDVLRHIPTPLVVMIGTYFDYIHNHQVFCAGDNRFGQCGRSRVVKSQWHLIASLEQVNIVQVATGGLHSVFLDEDGIVYTCGDNRDGQLGLGHANLSFEVHAEPMPIPIFISNQVRVREVACGYVHCLCVDERCNVYAWGYNKYGQCGLAHTQNVTVPTLIADLSAMDVLKIKCGASHSYCLTRAAEHYLFGRNNRSQCLLTQTYPVLVLVPFLINHVVREMSGGLQGIKEVYLGTNITFVITEEDSWKCRNCFLTNKQTRRICQACFTSKC